MVDATTQTEWSWLLASTQQPKTSCSPEPLLEHPQELEQQSSENSACASAGCDVEQEAHVNECDSSRPVDDLLDIISSSGESSSSADEREPSSPAPYPRLSSAASLPWPSILSYLRESESLASRHFSISDDSGSATRSRVPKKSTGPGQQHPFSCQFCEQPAPSFSLLPANQSQEPEFCCQDYRDYCILVAAYTKRRMDASAKQLPGRISITSHQPTFNKTAQDKALEKVRRKRKWEEQKRRQLEKLKSSRVYTLSQQARMIQFSLSSPTGFTSGWTAIPPQQGNSKESALRRSQVTAPASGLPSDQHVYELDQRQATSGLAALRENPMQELEYPDGKTAVLTLPDGTGQCYYPSQRLAVLAFSIHKGVLATLIFQDVDKSDPVGYCDELGRAWLTRNKQSLWFASTLQDCFVFDSAGRLKHWEWRNIASYSIALPLLLKVNKHVSLRYNSQDDVLLTFTAEHVSHRLKLHRKLKDPSSLCKDSPASEFKCQLNKLTHRFNGHLHCIQQIMKVMKAEQRKILPPLHGPQALKKTRSKSIGTVSFQS